jgi:hypothetical protein
MSSSLERILAKNNPRNYSQIHSERLRKRSIEKEFLNFTTDGYFRKREDFVEKHHKNIFMNPKNSGIKKQLNFTNTPSS